MHTTLYLTAFVRQQVQQPTGKRHTCKGQGRKALRAGSAASETRGEEKGKGSKEETVRKDVKARTARERREEKELNGHSRTGKHISN